MNIHIALFIASLCWNAIESVSEDDDGNDLAMQNPDLFEGDILGMDDVQDRNAVVEPYRKWPGGQIPFILDSSVDSKKDKILQAMEHYQDNTCIRFVPRKEERQYVKIFSGSGCYSRVGKSIGEQPLSLGPGCSNYAIIVHELGHAVGFYHEHSRSDRDDFLDIHYENIQSGMEDQFVKLRPKQNQLLTDFDYDSVMLYGETVFSKNHFEGLKTMTSKRGNKLQDITEKQGLSENDIKRIKLLYECS